MQTPDASEPRADRSAAAGAPALDTLLRRSAEGDRAINGTPPAWAREAAKTLLLQDVAGTLLKGVEMLGKKLAVTAHGVLLRANVTSA